MRLPMILLLALAGCTQESKTFWCHSDGRQIEIPASASVQDAVGSENGWFICPVATWGNPASTQIEIAEIAEDIAVCRLSSDPARYFVARADGVCYVEDAVFSVELNSAADNLEAYFDDGIEPSPE